MKLVFVLMTNKSHFSSTINIPNTDEPEPKI